MGIYYEYKRDEPAWPIISTWDQEKQAQGQS